MRKSKEQTNKLIFELLQKFIKDAKLNEYIDKYDISDYCVKCPFEFINEYRNDADYSSIFDDSFTWEDTEEGYDFWADVQFRFYWCLFDAGIVNNEEDLYVFLDRALYHKGIELSEMCPNAREYQLISLCRQYCTKYKMESLCKKQH